MARSATLPSGSIIGTDYPWMRFTSRRSPVLGLRGMVASSQPLASEAGMRILQKGGNAADAAVAVAAALQVTEPCSTGLGGDAFALYFDAKTKEVKCLQGNGRSPAKLTLDLVQERGFGGGLPPFHPLTVTVPGAPALWEDAVQQWGKLSLEQVLQPAVELAEHGFPVSPLTAGDWGALLPQLTQPGSKGAAALLTPDGKAPVAGQVMTNKDLANTFKRLGALGAKAGYYTGPVADAIVDAVTSAGGVLSHDDLAQHQTAVVDPITTTYRGYAVHELPPPNQGMAPLIALNLLELQPDMGSVQWGSPDHVHRLVECMRMAFADTLHYCADPHRVDIPLQQLLDKGRCSRRWEQWFKPDQAHVVTPDEQGCAVSSAKVTGGDTVYFCAVDGEGNGCSFINSNYWGFGTGIVPEGCGFSLQNRGHNFSLDPAHPNCLAPSKRPYHTIIPALVTSPEGELVMVFGVMGKYMQPQGQLQVLSNIIDFGMDPQTALDAPRFCIDGFDSSLGAPSLLDAYVLMEQGFDEATTKELARRGHTVKPGVSGHHRRLFGRGQVIMRDASSGVLVAGSDPRADGMAIGW